MRIPKRAGKRVMRKRVYKKRKPITKVSKAVKRYVKKSIAVQAENKLTNVSQALSFGSALESPDLNVWPILYYTGYHTLTQGVTQSSRVGNSIRIKKVYLKYVLLPLPYDVGTNASTQPLHIILYLANLRNARGVLPTSTDIGNLYQSNSTSSGPAGTLFDIIQEFNTDVWDVKKRWTEKIGFANNGGSGSQPTYQSYSNNDFALNRVRRMDISRYCPKICKFNDNAGGVVGNNLFFMFQAVSANGGATGATQLTARINYWVDIHYEDS